MSLPTPPHCLRRSAAVLAVLCVATGAGASPAAAQDRLTPIRYGMQVQGALASGDEQLTDDSYVDEYVFRGQRGEQVAILLRSAAFDTFLALGAYPDGQTWQGMATDDDSGGGTDSRVSFTLPANGMYVIRANSVEPNEEGAYTLQLVAAGADGTGPSQSPEQAGSPRQDEPGTAAQQGIRVGDEVEARWRDRWHDARVIGIRGDQLRVHYDGRPASDDAWVARSQLRYFPTGPMQTAPLAPGKYGCNVVSYNASSGMYEFNGKGFVVISADGRYQYLGFAQPSNGRYQVDPATRAASFSGGHLAGGVATPMVRRPGQFYLTAPNIGERWTCKK